MSKLGERLAGMKPCPFCGMNCLYETREYDATGYYVPSIFCNVCKITFYHEDDSMALDQAGSCDELTDKLIKVWEHRGE